MFMTRITQGQGTVTALGGTAISQVVNQGLTSVQDAALELQLFEMLSHLPLTGITSLVASLRGASHFIRLMPAAHPKASGIH